jgi:hypothetical protein
MILRKLALGGVALSLAMILRTTLAAGAPAGEKTPPGTTLAATASTAEKTLPPQIKLAALVAAARATGKTLPAESFDKYQVLITNNIFVRDRTRYAPRERDFTPAPVAAALGPEEATVLRGIVRQLEVPDAPYFAYLEDVRTGATVKVRMGDPVCQGKLIHPTLDGVDYVKNGVTTRIEIGKNLTGANTAPAFVPPAAASSAVQPTPVNGAGVSPAAQLTSPSAGASASPASTTPPSSLDSVAEQMRQKRLQELGK